MARNIEPFKIRIAEGPRRVLVEDFPSIEELPISGGWGYSPDDAVVIDKNDPVVVPGIPFNGVGIEYVYVEKRIYEELIIFRPKNARYSGIRWNLISQSVVLGEADKIYDHLLFAVTAVPDAEWEALKALWEGPNGVASPSFDVEAHRLRHEAATIGYEANYWFEISSFLSSLPR